jgi:hypothetical protein
MLLLWRQPDSPVGPRGALLTAGNRSAAGVQPSQRAWARRARSLRRRRWRPRCCLWPGSGSMGEPTELRNAALEPLLIDDEAPHDDSETARGAAGRRPPSLRRASLRLESAPVCFCDGMFRTGGLVGDQPFWRLTEATASGSYAQAGVGVLRLSASEDVVVAPAGRTSAARSTPGCERGPVDRGRAAPLPTGTRCSRGKHEPAVAGPACWNPVERRRARRAGPQGKSESAVDLVAAARSAGTRCCPAVGSAGGCWAPRVGDRGGNFVVFGACVAPCLGARRSPDPGRRHTRVAGRGETRWGLRSSPRTDCRWSRAGASSTLDGDER